MQVLKISCMESLLSLVYSEASLTDVSGIYSLVSKFRTEALGLLQA